MNASHHTTALQSDSLQVLPVVIQKLPLREDEEEYKTVYQVLRDLLRIRHHIVRLLFKGILPSPP